MKWIYYRLVSRLYDTEYGEEKWESRRRSDDKFLEYWEERAQMESELSLPTQSALPG
ncbi:hypothetical protein GJ744_006405 [Endocarpon pusillum]|uniref:Uncharacterized protein n=1 Tax=Endocarpon pusillum TaxID=364733 RepID=A0A8H7ANC4_9EURO|nr:hypothetical protein GJ744_006405 [Endocarpon pusillum]